MCAAQLDELPESDEPVEKKSSSGGGNLVPALIAIVLAPALTVGAMYFLINLNKPQETVKPQITEEVNLSIWNHQERRNFTN